MHTSSYRNSIEERIVGYQKCGLSFYDITHRPGRHPSTIIQIWNQWIVEGHTERHVESQSSPMTNAREDRHIRRSALQKPHNHISRTISQQMSMFQHNQFPFVRYVDVCNSVACQLCSYYFNFLWQCSTERDANSDEPNDKVACMIGTKSSFQASFDSACRTLMAA